ncbi:hypothetical protein BBJ28_00008467 [Nothophytophthora sp. Chile5]|nr:hypothetical protein BBJ28_00008467 [Nothophytophthora sp. Chile5]
MRGSWTPSLQPYPVEHDDNDLSKSPALAAMSALRDGRPPTAPGRTGTAQQMNGGSAYRSFGVRAAAGTPPSRHYYASDESSTYAVSAELLERLSITSEEEAEGVEDDEGRYRMPVYNAQVPTDQQRRQSERRGSYGNMSDGGDPGIFDFEDQ